MRELRNEIGRLKREYESLRYPGDLSRDVTRETPAHPGMRYRGFLAIAAAILLALTTWMLLPDKSPRESSDQTAASIGVPETTNPAEPITQVQQVTARADDAVVLIESSSPVVAENRPFRGPVESPFAVQLPTAQMPAGTYGAVSAPAWDNVPSSLSAEWIAMPQQTLTVPNVSEIDATLVSTEPAS